MKCPVCDKEMVVKDFGGVNVDVCENGCKGIWFDQDELRMLDENNEGLGAALDAALHDPRANDAQRGQLICPKCSIPMHAHRFERAQEVNVDECYSCGGFFLDSGELAEIRDHYMSDAQVKEYVDKIVNAVPGYTQEQQDLAAGEKRLDAIQHFTRLLTVNYWRDKL